MHNANLRWSGAGEVEGGKNDAVTLERSKLNLMVHGED